MKPCQGYRAMQIVRHPV